MDCRAPLAVTSGPLLREKCNAGSLANRLTTFRFIISAMRFFVLVLMMVLLPLRGWTGDALATDMAVSMTSQQMHQTATAVAKADAHQGHQSHKDHSDQMHDASHSPDHDSGTCESCSACQACHNVALMVTSDELTPRLNTHWTSTEVANPFASADAAHDQKPPIS